MSPPLPSPIELPTGPALIEAQTLTHSPVELGVFDLAQSWARAVHAGKASFGDRWRDDHPLVRFGEMFWMDMCRAVYDWDGHDLPRLKVVVRHNMNYEEGRTGVAYGAELAALMANLEGWLGRMRDTYHPDEPLVIPDEPAYRQGLAEDVMLTCACARDWARSVGLDDLAFEAGIAADELGKVC